MKYRSKLFYAFFVLALVSSIMGIIIADWEGSQIFLTQIRSEILSITETGALQFSGRDLEAFSDENTKDNPRYEQAIEKLRRIRNANRRESIYVRRAFIIKPTNHGRSYVFIADSEENPYLAQNFGNLFPATHELIENDGHSFVAKQEVKNRWGTWFSGFGKIKDSRGELVAFLGIEALGNYAKQQIHKLIFYGLLALAFSLIISAIIAHFLSRLVTSSLHELCDTVDHIGKGDLSTRVALDTDDEFDELGDAINHMAEGLEERERLKSGFARYVSSYVLDKILSGDIQTHMEGERKKVTLLFSDIRGFTTLAKNLPPEEVVTLLNEYFRRMIDIIFAHKGTLDKFLGDGIMVEFGAPLDDAEQEKNAVLTAIAMQKEIQVLSETWEKEGKPPIRVGIGIHTGVAVVGDIGSEIRMEYTAIGDAVNIASRIERMTKQTGDLILLSEETKKGLEGLGNEFSLEELEEKLSHDKTQPITLFKVVLS